jgi:hypothetical protein
MRALALLLVLALSSPVSRQGEGDRRCGLLGGGGLLAAQGLGGVSPYVPLEHWGMPYVEHLIARGAMADPSPLTRPLRRHDLRLALEAADTLRLSRGLRRVVRALVADLATTDHGPWGRVEARAGAAAATHARRDPLREAGPGHVTLSGGIEAQARFGPVVAATHPYFDTRLKWDPDYHGKKDRAVAGRNAEAYLAAQWRHGEVFFGALARNWGWPGIEGLVLSPAPYSYDHLALAIGTTAIRLEGVVTQLDDLPDTAGTTHHRYWVAHRLVARPWRRTTISLWEGTLLAGEDRTLEPWYANILKLGLLAQYDEGTSANNLLGVDVATRIGAADAFLSVLVDDIQIDDETAGDQEPPSYGLTLGARTGLGPAAWTAYYSRVSNLAYRTPTPTETVMRRDVGLGRNYSDYDQLTLRAEVALGPGILVTPEATLLRQGEGDFRLPYPAVADFPTTPVFLAGTPERTARLAADVRVDGRRWSIAANAGVHLVSGAGHVAGASERRFVGGLSVTYRLGTAGELP